MMSYSPFSSNEKLFLALKGEKEKEEKKEREQYGCMIVGIKGGKRKNLNTVSTFKERKKILSYSNIIACHTINFVNCSHL